MLSLTGVLLGSQSWQVVRSHLVHWKGVKDFRTDLDFEALEKERETCLLAALFEFELL